MGQTARYLAAPCGGLDGEQPALFDQLYLHHPISHVGGAYRSSGSLAGAQLAASTAVAWTKPEAADVDALDLLVLTEAGLELWTSGGALALVPLTLTCRS